MSVWAHARKAVAAGSPGTGLIFIVLADGCVSCAHATVHTGSSEDTVQVPFSPTVGIKSRLCHKHLCLLSLLTSPKAMFKCACLPWEPSIVWGVELQ